MKGRRREADFPRGRLSTFILAAGALVLTMSALSSCGGASRLPEPQAVYLDSGDGFRLGATLYKPLGEHPPGLALAHRYGGARASWDAFARRAQQRGIMVVAVDLRGHGDSRKRGEETVHYRQLPEDGWLDALRDLHAAKQALLAHGAHPDNLAAGGEGLGANLALHCALEQPDVQAILLISPGLRCQGVGAEEEMGRLKDCPAFIAATEGDAYASMSADALKAAAPVFAELRFWPGAAHGADLFAAHPEAADFTLDWLAAIYNPAPAPL